MTIPAPPRISDVPLARKRDVLRILWWLHRAFWYGGSRGPLRGRVVSWIVGILWWVTFVPLLLLTLFEVSSQSSSRYYMDPARCSAVLVVSTTKKGWKIEGHWSRQPGARQGEPLRELVVGPLMKAADEAHIVVYGTAATKKLADAYRKQVPELEIIGRSYIRGWRLRRDPRSAN